ncbi:hypothetical protein LF1_00540 [Rubripirellula obstinata]|uniref:Uncharacterized protein n=1 Tax=Rubripirellula obstinata TaxID=406547 RepID=A0A5B1C8W6_9BACT|nr:hypothetical protein LF1_00540 [Rubripirellula obstinata]
MSEKTLAYAFGLGRLGICSVGPAAYAITAHGSRVWIVGVGCGVVGLWVERFEDSG